MTTSSLDAVVTTAEAPNLRNVVEPDAKGHGWGFVYVLSIPEVPGRFKVGKSRSPLRRRKDLMCGSAFRLEIAGCWYCVAFSVVAEEDVRAASGSRIQGAGDEWIATASGGFPFVEADRIIRQHNARWRSDARSEFRHGLDRARSARRSDEREKREWARREFVAKWTEDPLGKALAVLASRPREWMTADDVCRSLLDSLAAEFSSTFGLPFKPWEYPCGRISAPDMSRLLSRADGVDEAYGRWSSYPKKYRAAVGDDDGGKAES